MPRGQRFALITVILSAICLLIVTVFVRSYLLMGMLAIAVIVFILEYFLILNRLVKINTKKMQETIHAKECEYTTSLSADRFKIKNHATNDMGTIDYDDISGFIETKNYYVLFGT